MIHPSFERVLVTGGSGFIGRHVVARLTTAGYSPLVTASNEERRPAADTTVLDLGDKRQIKELIFRSAPTAVVHLAGATGHNDPTGEICRRSNFEATVNLIDALRGSPVKRVVLIGTAAEYGNQPIPFREDMPEMALSTYARSKAEANKYALDAYSSDALPVTVLRVFTAWGPGQPRKMFLTQLIEAAVQGHRFEMSDGLQKRDLVHIVDVVDAVFATLAVDEAVGRTINIGSGSSNPLCDLAKAVWKACGADPALLEIGARDKIGDEAFDTEADISIARQILNWEPAVSVLIKGSASPHLLELISQVKKSDAVTQA